MCLHRYRNTLAFALVLVLSFYTITACGSVENDTNVNYKITFPTNEDEKTEYNSKIYGTEFTIIITLPEGITIDINNSYADGISGAFSNTPVINSDGDIIGCVGYNFYDAEQVAEGTDGDIPPMMIYNQIGLGSHYFFMVNDKYDIVSDTEKHTTAITYVYNDLFRLEQNGQTTEYGEDDYNYGIVSYCKGIPVYIALDLNRNNFTSDEIAKIAKSISFKTA